jgi:hypothetical protein
MGRGVAKKVDAFGRFRFGLRRGFAKWQGGAAGGANTPEIRSLLTSPASPGPPFNVLRQSRVSAGNGKATMGAACSSRLLGRLLARRRRSRCGLALFTPGPCMRARTHKHTRTRTRRQIRDAVSSQVLSNLVLVRQELNLSITAPAAWCRRPGPPASRAGPHRMAPPRQHAPPRSNLSSRPPLPAPRKQRARRPGSPR